MVEHLEQYSLPALCKGLRVSRSGFYAWRSRGQKVRAIDVVVHGI
jgi:hypothetical protein